MTERAAEPFAELARKIMEWAKGGTPLDTVAELHLRLALQDYFEPKLAQAARKIAERIPRDLPDAQFAAEVEAWLNETLGGS